MKSECREIQRALAEGGAEALRVSDRAQDHVADCRDCFSFLEAVAEVDAGLAELAPIDAPDEVVDQLLANLSVAERERSPEPEAASAGPERRSGLLAAARTLIDSRMVQLSVATAAALILTFLITPQLLRQRFPMAPPMSPVPSSEELQAASQTGQGVGQTESASNKQSIEERDRRRRLEALGYVSEDADGEREVDEVRADLPQPVGADPASRQAKEDGRFSERMARLNEGNELEELTELEPDRPADVELENGAVRREPRSRPLAENERVGTGGLESSSALDRLEGGAQAAEGLAYLGNRELAGRDEAHGAGDKKSEISKSPLLVSPDEPDPVGPEAKPAEVQGGEGGRGRGRASDVSPSFGDSVRESVSESTGKGVRERLEARDVAERFLRERERVEGVDFRPATGYWANTYVPGDPFLRLLYSRLQGMRRERLAGAAPAPVALHDDVTRLVQPFDPPQNAALALYLHSDRSHLEGRQRMLLQVGLQGTERSSGRRGAMNVGLVLDLGGELAAESAAAVRSLVEAFGEARDIGDRFHLVVAGRPTDAADGVVVKPEAFRHGPLRVAVESLLASPDEMGGAGATGSPVLDVHQAMATAMDRVAGGADPNAILGSSVVVLVTARTLDERFEPLRKLAHTSAIAGVPVSVVGIGDRVDPAELERLALWGQGNRRLLEAAAGASALVDRELTAASRTIARAVRLRIRLAPGVELIDVVGSRRLDDEDSRRVREAENNIDLRLARNLGIEADRGEDEEGIQIVMPSFLAGDSHVILLDVVAPGPGPVADVTVRYKDLVRLRNGVGRAHLELGRIERAAGALETNVLENFLAQRLFEGLDAAGRLLQAGDVGAARQLLAELRSLLSGVTILVAGLEGDVSLEADVALLDEYLSVLDQTDSVSDSDRALLADSLRLSGRLKVSAVPTSLSNSLR